MKPSHLLRATLLLGASLFVLAACQKDDGPAEKTGEKIDEAMEQTADTMKDATETAVDKLEEAGEKIEDSTNRQCMFSPCTKAAATQLASSRRAS